MNFTVDSSSPVSGWRAEVHGGVRAVVDAQGRAGPGASSRRCARCRPAARTPAARPTSGAEGGEDGRRYRTPPRTRPAPRSQPRPGPGSAGRSRSAWRPRSPSGASSVRKIGPYLSPNPAINGHPDLIGFAPPPKAPNSPGPTEWERAAAAGSSTGRCTRRCARESAGSGRSAVRAVRGQDVRRTRRGTPGADAAGHPGAPGARHAPCRERSRPLPPVAV